MLRILVISLVVANLLLLGFQSSKPSVKSGNKATSAEVRESRIPTIHLFSEMVQDQGLLSSNRQCFTLGPFHSSEDRDDVYKRLLQVSTRIGERRTEALVEKGYWVYMPPYASMLEANKALLSLRALGLKDLAIIYDGEWKNAISLGYFLRQENAQKRKQGLEKKGYKPMIRIRREAEPRYWLDYEQNPGSGLIALDMQSRPNDFMQRPVPCPAAEFIETEAVASQAVGQVQAQQNTTAEDASANNAEDQATQPSETAENTAGEEGKAIPDEPSADAQVESVEPGPDQDAANAAEKTQDTSDGKKDGVDGDNAVQTPTEQKTDTEGGDTVEATSDQDKGKLAEAAVEALPGQAVGTGPEHTVSAEPVQAKDDATEQGDQSPNDQQPENKPDAGEKVSTGDGAVTPPKDDKDNATGQAAPK